MKKLDLLKILKFPFSLIFYLLLLQSCVSKKQMLYLQDVDTVNSQEVTYNNHTLQVDDILKISVSTH